MRAAVIQFPGSNCDSDALHALRSFPEIQAEMVWHGTSSLDGFDLIVLPGGFSYGDYLRCGAIACFSPIMAALAKAATEGKLILGICNGFQILCEAGLLPGTLIRNRNLLFRCEERILRVETTDSPFTNACSKGALLRLPIAHGEGCYFAEESTLQELNKNHQILIRYADKQGETTKIANPNGSLENIAGICNRERNIFGLMPHPERACDALLGSTDGRILFQGIINQVTGGR
ncbi:MAG: phosphoribosylformylglycinamidine synthase I [Verrucomicrobia bacterium RIFCSPHIGHO2_12_FULL_41_10]|nr:MAG: phosphoribosylformylglycinamidine synthase I [Verrucomicrobia bacterium RIFCSPHIGHO2_12_FULL_41_10]HLB34351.1 phosphoribosylformylglycinamidine synthase subunit PurQ [Chthoniobacterales bacterium]